MPTLEDMTPTMREFRDLLSRGERRPVVMTLASSWRSEKLTFDGGYVVGETMIFIIDPAGVEVRRAPETLHLLRDGRDVLRRTPQHCWAFENFGEPIDPPVRIASPGISCPGALGWFLRQHAIIQATPLQLCAVEEMSTEEIADRPTWVLQVGDPGEEADPGQLVSLEIDQEHGVILAVETGQERIEVTEISFPDVLPDPAWDGTWEPFHDPDVTLSSGLDTAEIPGYREALPAQSADPRRLRVFVGEMALEGAFPDYHIGQSLRLSLGIDSSPAPVAGLSTIRRGRVSNLGEEAHPDADGTPQWPILLTGDGWTALTHTPTPVRGEAEVHGWFYYSAYGMTDVPTDLRVERIFAGIGTVRSEQRYWQEVADTSTAYRAEDWWIHDVVLDVTLDGVAPPELGPEIFAATDPVLVGHRLWLGDADLPVVRCWDTTTGRYLGQTLVPAPMRDVHSVLKLHADQQWGAVAANGQNGWMLQAGETVATKAPEWSPPDRRVDFPAVPEPWEIFATRGDGLFELEALTDTGGRTALARVDETGEVTIGELPATGYTISSVVQIGDEYVVRRWVEEDRLDAGLKVISTREVDLSAPGWGSRGSVAYLVEGSHVHLFDRASGVELPGLEIAEGYLFRVLAATPTEITALIYLKNQLSTLSILPVAVATCSHTTWTMVELQEAPAEMFGDSDR